MNAFVGQFLFLKEGAKVAKVRLATSMEGDAAAGMEHGGGGRCEAVRRLPVSPRQERLRQDAMRCGGSGCGRCLLYARVPVSNPHVRRVHIV